MKCRNKFYFIKIAIVEYYFTPIIVIMIIGVLLAVILGLFITCKPEPIGET